MTQNPFDNLGAGGDGGFDMNALLEQATQMQAQLEQAQARLNEQEVRGEVAGVAVTVNGVGELRGVDLKPGAFDLGDAEAAEELGDLIVAAYRDAKTKADELAAQALGPLAGGAGGGLPGMG